MGKVLVVDDHRASRATVAMTLRKQGHEVDECACASEALEAINKTNYDLIVTDMRIPIELGGVEDLKGGLRVIDAAKSADANIAIIVITAYASVDNALEALHLGTSDYLVKEFSKAELEIKAAMALEKRRLKLENLRLMEENIQLKDRVREKYQFDKIIGQSKAMQGVFEMIKIAARNPDNVLIQGESGTGKELVANAIHCNSQRRNARFVTINCAALPHELIESELFGHKKGAFTGATTDRKGAFEEADGGTIFLDEIGDMPLEMQSRLLRAIEQKEVKPVGASVPKIVDVRVIAATNRNLPDMITKGSFREDLFYRLNVIRISLPALRDRKEDIPLLANHFIRQVISERNTEVKGISAEALGILEEYDWPGNVRQLQNVLLTSILSTQGPMIEPHHLPEYIRRPKQEIKEHGRESLSKLQERVISELSFPISREDFLNDMERRLILRSLRESRDNVSEAARKLLTPYSTLQRRINELGL